MITASLLMSGTGYLLGYIKIKKELKKVSA